MKRHIAIHVPLIAALALGGCAVGPDFQRPSTPAVDAYVSDALPATTDSAPVPGGESQQFAPGAQVPVQWWKEFGSTDLDAMVEAALKANPGLEEARAALRAASENAAADGGGLLPSVDAQWNSSRARASEADVSPLTLHTGQLVISYAPDVFGGTRRQIESSQAQMQVQQFQREAVYMTLVANVVNAAIQEASLNEQIAATEELVKLSSRLLDISKKQHSAGQIGGVDVVSQESALALIQLTLPPLRKQLSAQRNALAVLLGRMPSEASASPIALAALKLPRELPLGIPSQLVEQRPDVRAAEAQLHAASAQIGVAKAARFPSFTLTASAGRFGDKLPALLRAGGGFWALGAGVAQPLFHGGALMHRQRAAEASYDVAAAQYRGAVLTAFQNTADTLQAIVSDSQVLSAASTAQNAAGRTLRMVQRQRELGAASQSDLVIAQKARQEADMALIQARAARYSNTVALYQSLGGWWEAGDPAAAGVASK